MSPRLQPLVRVRAFRARGARRLTAGAAAAGAVLGMAACSSHEPPAASLGSPSSPAASAAVSSPSGTPLTGTTLTGTQLGSALAPASSFPGFTVNTQVAWAHFDRSAGGAMTQTYDEFIYQFGNDSAAGSFLQRLRSAFGRCQSYSDVEGGVKVRTAFAVADVAPVGGGQAMQATATATASVGTVSGEFLCVLRGNVYGVVRAGPQAGVPASPSASVVIQGMMTHVQAMSS
jgi:hypothetical protein